LKHGWFRKFLGMCVLSVTVYGLTSETGELFKQHIFK